MTQLPPPLFPSQIRYATPEEGRLAGIFWTTGAYSYQDLEIKRHYWHTGMRISETTAQTYWEAYLRGLSDDAERRRKAAEAWTVTYPADPVVETNMRRLAQRADVGMKTYGQSMEDHKDESLEYWIDHTIEELLDAANYLEKLKRDLVTKGLK